MFSFCSFIIDLLPLPFKSQQDCINPQNIYNTSMLLLSTYRLSYCVDRSSYYKIQTAIDR